MSAPQVGAQFGSINNNGTGGGNVSPYGEANNQSSNVPGQGYPGEYYSHHSNESSPTSPSMSGSEVNVQNSSLPTSNCDCNQMTEVQEMAPTNAGPSDAPNAPDAPTAPDAPAAPGGDPADAASSASSSSSSSRK